MTPGGILRERRWERIGCIWLLAGVMLLVDLVVTVVLLL